VEPVGVGFVGVEFVVGGVPSPPVVADEDPPPPPHADNKRQSTEIRARSLKKVNIAMASRLTMDAALNALDISLPFCC
jgi:hypothetical protein